MLSRRTFLKCAVASTPLAGGVLWALPPELNLEGTQKLLPTLSEESLRGDASDEINEKIRLASERNEALFLEAGIYPVEKSILLRSGLTLRMDPAAVLVRKTAESGAFAKALMTTGHPRARLENINVSGGLLTYSDPQKFGKVLSIFADNVTISGLQISGFNGGQAITAIGDNIRISDSMITTDQARWGNGGIRFAGGKNFICENTQVISGDDAIQFVPIPYQRGVVRQIADLSIHNGKYRNCSAVSLAARSCVVGMTTPYGGKLTSSITDCHFMGIEGSGGNMALGVVNPGSTGTITDVSIQDCTLSDQKQLDLPASYRIVNAENVRVQSCLFTGEQNILLQIRDCSNVHFRDSSLKWPQSNWACADRPVLRQNSSHVSFMNCKLPQIRRDSSKIRGSCQVNGDRSQFKPAKR